MENCLHAAKVKNVPQKKRVEVRVNMGVKSVSEKRVCLQPAASWCKRKVVGTIWMRVFPSLSFRGFL